MVCPYCPICGYRMKQVVAKENEWTFRADCPNKCYSIIDCGGSTSFFVHTEGSTEPDACVEFPVGCSHKTYRKLHTKLVEEIKKAKEVWDQLKKECK